MKRIIQITEFLQKVFTVEADTEEEIWRIVDDEYRKKGNIVLDANDYTGNEIQDVTDDYVGQFPTIDDVIALSKAPSSEDWLI